MAGRQSAILRIARTFKPTHFSRNISIDTPVTVEKKQQPGPVAVQPVRDVMVADVISGAPGAFENPFLVSKISIPISAELRHRSVRIYQPTRNTMQSGAGKSERWRVDWDILEGGGLWENPLMGYASSCVYLYFNSYRH